LFPERFRPFLKVLDDGSISVADIPAFNARRTKIVCTIGPVTASYEQLLKMAALGMNVVRLNMSHGDYVFHDAVIGHVRRINTESPFVLATMLDIGSFDQVRLGEFPGKDLILKSGDQLTITARHEASYPEHVTEVSDDAFMDVVQPGDVIEVRGNLDGSVVLLRVQEICNEGKDARCVAMEAGRIRSRAPIAIRGKSFKTGPPQSGAFEHDLEFAIRERVEMIALSFVERAEQIMQVKTQLRQSGASNTAVVAKIESAVALEHLPEIVQAADAIMIARGDLGTDIRYDMVPFWQQKISQICRAYAKPCIVSTHFLESMVLYPTPTRAEVTDIAEAVKQQIDALMLTSETASGKYPLRALSLMSRVALRIEGKMATGISALKHTPRFQSNNAWSPDVLRNAERVCATACAISEQLQAAAILCFTQRGFMATLLSRCRPGCPVYAFTSSVMARNKMSMLYGVRPFRILFDGDPEVTVQRAMEELRDREALHTGDRIVVVADVLGGRNRATEEEMLLAFGNLDRENRGYISRALVRRGLRELGLKAGDDVELETWLEDFDQDQALIEECTVAPDFDECMERVTSGMERADSERPSTADNRKTRTRRRMLDQVDYAAFRQLVQDSAEIVQTIQFRVME
jgi:pyruvate kinase